MDVGFAIVKKIEIIPITATPDISSSGNGSTVNYKLSAVDIRSAIA